MVQDILPLSPVFFPLKSKDWCFKREVDLCLVKKYCRFSSTADFLVYKPMSKATGHSIRKETWDLLMLP
jgi:hypothetical protein